MGPGLVSVEMRRLSVGRADALSEAFPALILLLLDHLDDARLWTAA